MKKKFLGKKVLVSLLAGGMLYSGGALLPDYAVDKVGQLLPGMLNVAMADDYRDITDHIKFDLALSAEPGTIPDPPNDYHWIGEKTLKMTGEYTVTLKGTNKTLALSVTENSGSVVIESGASITVGADRYIYPLVKIGSGDTAEASLAAKANQLVGGVLLQKNSVLNLDAGTFDGTIQATGGGNVDNYTAKIVVSGNVIFKDESAIKFGKSKPRGTIVTDNSKVLEIATGAELTIRADKLIFDEGNNLLKNNASLVFKGGVLGANVIVEGTGTTTIQDTVTMNANQVQNDGGILLADESVLNLTGTTDSGKTTGELQVKIEADTGAKAKVVVGSGQKIKTKAGETINIGTSDNKVDIENAGNIDFTGDIVGDITNSGGDTANVGFKHIGNMLGSITNTGNYEFADTEKSIQKGKISNSGKMLVKGSIAIAEDTNGTITNSGDFTAEKGIAAKKIINNVGGTFTATGGTNTLNITNGIENNINATMTIEGNLTGGLIDNSGTLTTKGTVANNINNQSTGTMTAGGALTGAVVNKGDFTVDAGNIGTTSFDNSGTVHLGSNDSLTNLTQAITDSNGTGVLSVEGEVTNTAAITQKSLTIDTGKKLTTDLDKLTISDKYITNKGTLVVSDDSILTIDIKDSNGTTELTSGKKLVVGEDHTIEGTLKGNGGTIDMTERGLGVLKSDTELQKLENAEIHTLTIGKLAGGLNLKIDVDMANFTADKLTVGAADYASLTLSSINVIKDYIPQKDDYGTDDFEINVPTVIDGIHGDDTKAQNAITFVDGAGANNVNCAMGLSAASDILGEYVPTYTSVPTTTEVITNNYKYTFAMGDTKGTLDYKVEQLNVMFKDFIEGTLPGYGTADGDNKEVDPSILCLTADMTIPEIAAGDEASMGEATQKNAVLNINLNGHKLDGQTAESLKVDVTADKTLNINGGGETAAGIITKKVNFDVADGGALVFDGKTEINGEINNAANGNVVNAKSGILELKGEIANAGTITNKAEGDSLGRMTITDGGVTGTGKIVNNGQLLVDADIENDLYNVTTASTVSQLLIKEGNTVSGDLYNGNAEAENAYGLVDIQDAGDLGGTGKKVYNYGGYINIEKGILTRDVVNDEGALFIGTNGVATINGNISQSESLPEEADPTTYICGNVTFSGDGKEISNSVHVVKSTIIQGFVPHYNDDFTNIPAVEAGYTGIFTIEKGTVTGDVEVDNEAELYNKVSGLISGFVTNKGTMETKANGITGHTAGGYTGENKNIGVQNLNSLTLYSGDLGTGVKDVDSGELKGTTYIAAGEVVSNNNNYTITQKSLIINEDASLKTDVDVVHIGAEDAGPIVNDGILSFIADGSGNGQYSDDTVDTLQEKVTNTLPANGTLNFGLADGTNTFHALGDITQKVVNVNENLIMDAKLITTETVGETNVADEKYLKIAAGNLQSKVYNGEDSIVKLTAGTLGEGYTIDDGMIEISPDEEDDPASGNVTIKDVNDLQSTQGIINAKYVLTLQGTGALVDNIYGKKLDGEDYVTAIAGDAEKYGTTVIDTGAEITVSSGIAVNNNVVVKGKLNNGGTIIGGVVVAADAELDAATDGGFIKNAKVQESVPVTDPKIIANKVINYGLLKTKTDNIQGFDEVINMGILELNGQTVTSLQYEINEGGSMTRKGKTIIEGGLVRNVTYGTNGNKLIVQKEIEIKNSGKLETDADNLQISDRITNDVDNGLILVDEGTLNTSVYGSGSTQIGKNSDDVADVTMNGIFNQKVEIKEGSTLHISANGLKKDGNIDEGLLILGAGTLGATVIGNDKGCVEYAGDVVVNKMPAGLKGMKIDDGVKVDFSNANNRTMTVSDVNIGSNTTMFLNAPTGVSVDRVDALNSNDAVINGVNTSFSTGSGNMLYLKNTVEKNKTYVVVGGTAVTGNERPWDLIETDNFDVELVYISDPKAFGEAKAGVVAFKALPAPSIIRDIDCDAPNVFTEMKNVLPVESDERQFLREINVTYRDEKQKGLDAWNSVASLNAVAGVTRNVLSSTTLALATVNEHLMTVKVPVQYGGYRSGRAALIDTVSDNFQGMIPEIIPGGDTQSVMPQRVTGRSSRAISRQSRSGGSSKKYQITSENQVWASYIQSKETIDGLKAGDATNNSEIKYKGASVGIDMWSTDKSIGGIYGSYVEGKVDANNSAAITRNEIDNYGVGIYNRLDYKFASVLIDAGYVHSKNDIRQENLGREITAKPKVDAYSAGIRIEKMCAAGSSTITPFIGVRYMNVQTQSYDNSMGIRHKIDDEDLFTIPVGLKWCADLNPDSKMRFRPSIEGGYNFNIGGRDNKQKISFNGVTDTVKFNALDKGNYFVRVGMEFVGSNTILGLFYKYSKGDHIKDNKFNVNLSFDF